jgi:hypothetical protein
MPSSECDQVFAGTRIAVLRAPSYGFIPAAEGPAMKWLI